MSTKISEVSGNLESTRLIKWMGESGRVSRICDMMSSYSGMLRVSKYILQATQAGRCSLVAAVMVAWLSE